MKKGFLIIILLFFTISSFGQDQGYNQVKVGDILLIGKPSGYDYKHIMVPKKNLIIKKGGLAKIDALKNMKVVVVSLKTHRNQLVVTLAREDGKKFFGSHNTMRASVVNGLKSGELRYSK